jgi:hypothetical protein
MVPLYAVRVQDLGLGDVAIFNVEIYSLQLMRGSWPPIRKVKTWLYSGCKQIIASS